MKATPVLVQVQHLKTACANCSVLELCLPIGLTESEVVRLDTLIPQRLKVKKGSSLYRSADKHACHAIALEDSEVCPLHFSQLERLASQIPSLQHNLNKIMSREIVREHGMLLQMGNMNADERLSAFLLNISLRMSTRGYSPRTFVLRMRREEIGSYLGLRLETVCRSIAQLRKQGLVHVSGRNVEILDMPKLKSFIARCFTPHLGGSPCQPSQSKTGKPQASTRQLRTNTGSTNLMTVAMCWCVR